MNKYHCQGHRITKEDVKALKHADCIAFDFDGENGKIRAIIRQDFGGEAIVAIPTDTMISVSRTNDQRKTEELGEPENVRTCYTLLYPYYDQVKTAIENIRADDIITLHWTVSTGNSYLEGATSTVRDSDGNVVANETRLFLYTLKMEICRPLKNGTKRMAFVLDWNTSPFESYGAMVRWHR